MELMDYINELHSGRYPEMYRDRDLYELTLLVVREPGPTIRIIKYERPTKIERLKFRYSLKGIKIEAIDSPFNRYELEYHVIINRDQFLNNLDIFYDQDPWKLKAEYDKVEARKREALRRAEKVAKQNGKPSPLERFIIAKGSIVGRV